MITPLMRTLVLRNGVKYCRLVPSTLQRSSFNQLRSLYLHQTGLLKSGKLNIGSLNTIFGILHKASLSDQARKASQDPDKDKKAVIARVVGLTLFCVSAILFMPILVYYGQSFFT